MISVMIECENDEHALAQTLAALVPGAIEGLISEVIVVDLASDDGSRVVADAAGCRTIAPHEIAHAVRDARADWLLLLEPGARPAAGWMESVLAHLAAGGGPARFRATSRGAGSFWRGLFGRGRTLDRGLLVRRADMLARCDGIERLAAAASGLRPVRLDCRLLPAASTGPKRRA